MKILFYLNFLSKHLLLEHRPSLIFLGLACLGQLGCASLEDANYLNQSHEVYLHQSIRSYQHTIEPGDLLFVDIASGDLQVDRLFNAKESGKQGSDISKGAYLSAYIVSNNGFLSLPLIDSVKVAGLKLEHAEEKLDSVYSTFLVDPHLQLKLGAFPLTILGEVTNPGVHLLNQPRATLFEALGYAGDITDYGNKHRVTIIREENGKRTLHQVDLTTDEILTSAFYYLEPQDVVYIPATRRILLRTSGNDYMMLVGTLSSTLTVLLLILNLTQ